MALAAGRLSALQPLTCIPSVCRNPFNTDTYRTVHNEAQTNTLTTMVTVCKGCPVYSAPTQYRGRRA
ncbi:UNVERIFIED_CONTAM: hypothetical protein Sradi_7244900 [Sesamum radiatum]|uniref:Uncharacterized protein n=1 Tax=Sesamum radiatum TaxID=300843 RepID=A0AAW2ILA9_SESRA